MKLSDKELQKQIDIAAKASNDFMNADGKIQEHCKLVYGMTYSDADSEVLVDALGGVGGTNGITVKELDAEMKIAIKTGNFN